MGTGEAAAMSDDQTIAELDRQMQFMLKAISYAGPGVLEAKLSIDPLLESTGITWAPNRIVSWPDPNEKVWKL